MRLHIILPALLVLIGASSCVATTGDLRDINAALASEVQDLTTQFDQSLATIEAKQAALLEERLNRHDAALLGATSDELRERDARIAELQDELQASIAREAEASKVAVDEAIDAIGAAVEGKVKEIQARVEGVATQTAQVGQKLAEGPQGWLELIGIVLGGAGASAYGAHRYTMAKRDASREKSLRSTGHESAVAAITEAERRFNEKLALLQQPPLTSTVPPPYQPPAGTTGTPPPMT
jgi:hypothetical protein